MTGWHDADAALPSSHVFLTIARGHRQKTIAISRWTALTAAIVLVFATLWSVGCTFYVAAHDTLLSAMTRRERDLQFDYEDQIAALQRQLERALSQHAQTERAIGSKLETLANQEVELRRNAGTVSHLAQQLLHLSARSSGTLQEDLSHPAPSVGQVDGALEKTAGRIEPDPGQPLSDRLANLSSDLGVIASRQQQDLTSLQSAAADRLTRFRDALTGVGLTAGRFAAPAGAGMGGPFVPLDPSKARTPFERTSLELLGTLAETEKMKGLVAHVPFGKPLEGSPEVTSPFGARIDPFLGRAAMHTGLDLRDETGTSVLATAPGRVSFAGSASGYGTMVEIDHGNGLATRYAHLSAISVALGEHVEAEEVIGRVGATGRATGPHLHYETRIDGEPVDPMRFLTAGSRLFADSAAHQ
ncbi:M23 family metallopeptidase [Lichenifustis flavocetrariae]|uniref:Peptidoglycan DD-metalloendopeptidase family protein n=1 Tax=Lichenifustis flavocetrariae TaxID=2949735 RepID=A0AA42CN49_9HYPH|nr:M23 family metallopeptidase [Lichenifustis flavocetrariae]MCW6509020.1 peptidoglycan DD-metalloendopeptidase family protein [Lichenifustis flavocetrariae]